MTPTSAPVPVQRDRLGPRLLLERRRRREDAVGGSSEHRAERSGHDHPNAGVVDRVQHQPRNDRGPISSIAHAVEPAPA